MHILASCERLWKIGLQLWSFALEFITKVVSTYAFNLEYEKDGHTNTCSLESIPDQLQEILELGISCSKNSRS
jgi:hypothetical protein